MADGAAMDGRSMALLFAADRIDHLKREIEPYLAAGTTVISDRYLLSSLAYQAEEADRDWVLRLARGILRPDLTILLDLPIEIAAKRREAAGRPVERYDADSYLAKVAANYRALACQDPSVVTLDGAASKDEVTAATVPGYCATFRTVARTLVRAHRVRHETIRSMQRLPPWQRSWQRSWRGSGTLAVANISLLFLSCATGVAQTPGPEPAEITDARGPPDSLPPPAPPPAPPKVEPAPPPPCTMFAKPGVSAESGLVHLIDAGLPRWMQGVEGDPHACQSSLSRLAHQEPLSRGSAAIRKSTCAVEMWCRR